MCVEAIGSSLAILWHVNRELIFINLKSDLGDKSVQSLHSQETQVFLDQQYFEALYHSSLHYHWM